MALSTGADSPDKITHCFVLAGGDLVWSMLEGEKVYPSDDFTDEPISINSKYIENRHTRLAPGWYGVILGKGSKGVTLERHRQCQEKLPSMTLPSMGHDAIKRRKGCVVGIVKIAHSLPHEYCEDSPWAVEEYPVCNIISHAGWIDRPIECKGNLGACPIKEENVRDRIREYADCAYRAGNIFPTGAELKYPWRGAGVWDKGRKRKASTACIDLKDKDDVGKLRAFLLNAKANVEAKMAKGS
jgi:hypothetical protein